MTWTVENYYGKAQLYWDKATSRGQESEDFLLNACFTVEYISRGALCSVNPTLNAAMEVESLYFACGLEPRTPPKTIEFIEVLKRLKRLIPVLSDHDISSVKALVEARNSELHSDLPVLSGMSSLSIISQIYPFIYKVTEFSGQSLDILLGEGYAKTARSVVEAKTKDRTKRVKDLIRVCKERFFGLDKLKQQELREANNTSCISVTLVSGDHIIYSKCPACSQTGELKASPVGESIAYLKDNELLKDIRVIPTQFHCKCCALNIHGLDELMAAGFNHEYCSVAHVDPIEHFEIDPNEYVDHELIAREYHQTYYEDYSDE